MAGLTGYFIDYEASGVRDEVTLAFGRTAADGLGDFGSLRGRTVCVIKVLTHAAGVIIKPLYYLGLFTVLKIVCIMNARLNLDDLAKDPNDPYDKDSRYWFKNTPLLNAWDASANLLLGGALAAPFSQLIQLFKATLGIIHPGIYFKSDDLESYFKELGDIAEQVGCSAKLVERFRARPLVIYKTLNDATESRMQYLAQFKQDLKAICERLCLVSMSSIRKKELLSYLEPDSDDDNDPSGIDSCTPGLGRLLQQIRIEMMIPSEPREVLGWLNDQWKRNVIDNMARTAGYTEDVHDAKAIVFRLGVDEMHRANVLTVAIGQGIGLSVQEIEQAKKDFMAVVAQSVSEEDLGHLVGEFNRRYTNREDRYENALNQINSKADGSPGLKSFRDQIIQHLAGLPPCADQPDPATHATTIYYVNGGRGDASAEGFNNLNLHALKAYAATFGTDNPFENLRSETSV